MEALFALPAGMAELAEEAQRICAAAGPAYRAHCTACYSFADKTPAPSFVLTVFDTNTAEVTHQTGPGGHSTPERALAMLALLLGVTYPFATVEYATADQKEELIRLLNHPKIERREKTLMLVALPRFTSEYAKKAIAKIQKAIEDREAQPLGQMAVAA